MTEPIKRPAGSAADADKAAPAPQPHEGGERAAAIAAEQAVLKRELARVYADACRRKRDAGR